MKNKLIIIIGSIVLIIVIIFIVVILNKDDKVKNKKNSYNIESKKIELPNTIKYTNDNLNKSHCINDICISKLVFYSTDNGGRIEYDIYNSSNDRKSGVLRLNFSGEYLIIVYDDLAGQNKISSFSGFEGMSITNKNDYVLEEYSDKDIIGKKK